VPWIIPPFLQNAHFTAGNNHFCSIIPHSAV
jgi:hypothetical protein